MMLIITATVAAVMAAVIVMTLAQLISAGLLLTL